MEIAFVLGLLVLAIFLFSLEVLPVDLVTLLLIVALLLGGVLSPADAFAGFASEIIFILASIFVISGALQQTGVLGGLGERLSRVAGGSARRLATLFSGATGLISTVTNNTTATAVFLPPALEAARHSNTSPSKLLLPLAYGSILGGTCTLIGTSTNVAVSGAMEGFGLAPLTLFELTPVGLILFGVGILYLSTIGYRLLPDHRDESLSDAYEIREYLSEIVVGASATLVGQRVFESDLSRTGYRVLEVERGGEAFLPTPETRVEAGDVLLIQASVEQLARLRDTPGLGIKELRVGDRELQPGAVRLAEAMVAPKSNLLGRTLAEVRFRQQFGVTALAIHRGGHSGPARVGRERLRQGDLLLIQGPRERIQTLLRDPNLWVLETPGARSLPERRRGLYVVGFFLVAIVLGAAGLVPLSAALLTAAIAAVLVRAITTEEAYRFIEWKLLILVGGMTAFGTAMTSSGAAALLADGIADVLGPLGPLVVLGGFALLTVLLTQPMSNAAAALLVLPVAIQTATELGLDPRTFAVTIALAASVSLATPLEPSCLIVYGPGKYRFRDFVIVGGPLTMVLLAVLLVLVPVFWPL